MLRKLRDTDRAGWEPLWQGYVAFYNAAVSAEQTELTWGRLHDSEEPIHGFVFDDDGELLGFSHLLVHRSTWAPVGYGYLEDLFVTPEARGRGVGRALIERVYKEAEERGLSRVHWVTQKGNPARSLYDKVAKESDFVQYRFAPRSEC